MRSAGRLGWGGGGSAPPIPTSTTIVTEGYPYTTGFVPALAMNPYGESTVATPVLVNLKPTANYHTYYAWKFLGIYNDAYNVYWQLPIKKSEIDVVAPSFKISPLWVQFTNAVAPVNKWVTWRAGIWNSPIGTTLDNSLSTSGTIASPVRDRWVLSGGNTASSENVISIPSIDGSALSATNTNFLTFTIGRLQLQADNYTADAYLLGFMFQFKNNFANVSVWP